MARTDRTRMRARSENPPDNGLDRDARRRWGGVGAPVRNTGPSTEARTGLAGRPLRIARAAWGAAVAVVVGLALISLPFAYAEFQDVCAAGVTCKPYWRLTPGDVLALRDFGLSTAFYAAYRLAAQVVYLLGFWVVAAVIFWRRSDSLPALFFSFMLVTFGALPVMEFLGRRAPGPRSAGCVLRLLRRGLLLRRVLRFPRRTPRTALDPLAAGSRRGVLRLPLLRPRRLTSGPGRVASADRLRADVLPVRVGGLRPGLPLPAGLGARRASADQVGRLRLRGGVRRTVAGPAGAPGPGRRSNDRARPRCSTCWAR